MPVLKIVIADSQYLVREGLKRIIGQQRDMQVIADVSNAAALYQVLDTLDPDMVILDHDSPEFFAGARWDNFLSLADRSTFLIISQDHSRSRITALLEHGIHTILTKYCDEDEIVSAIRAASRREKFFCTKVLDILVDSVRDDNKDTCIPTCLTQREVEIVQLIAGGCKTRDVAERLHLSPHTVNTHRKNIFKKLGIRSGNELVLFALDNGLIRRTA